MAQVKFLIENTKWASVLSHLLTCICCTHFSFYLLWEHLPGVFGNSQLKSRGFWRTRCLICVFLCGPVTTLPPCWWPHRNPHKHKHKHRTHQSWRTNTRSVTSSSGIVKLRWLPSDLTNRVYTGCAVSRSEATLCDRKFHWIISHYWQCRRARTSVLRTAVVWLTCFLLSLWLLWFTRFSSTPEFMLSFDQEITRKY